MNKSGYLESSATIGAIFIRFGLAPTTLMIFISSCQPHQLRFPRLQRPSRPPCASHCQPIPTHKTEPRISISVNASTLLECTEVFSMRALLGPTVSIKPRRRLGSEKLVAIAHRALQKVQEQAILDNARSANRIRVGALCRRRNTAANVMSRLPAT